MGSAEELSESGRRMRLAREAGGGVPGFLAGSLLINHNPGYFYTNNSKINDPSLLPGWLLLVQRLLRKSRSGMVTGGCGPALLSAWVGPRRLSLRKPLLGGPCPRLLCGFQCRARLCRVCGFDSRLGPGGGQEGAATCGGRRGWGGSPGTRGDPGRVCGAVLSIYPQCPWGGGD